jgi:hypothetical protein
VKTHHFAQLVGLSALWGASFMFLRIASPVLGPWVLAGGRVALAALTLALLMRLLRHRWPWEHWKELALLGALSVSLPFLLYAWAALRPQWRVEAGLELTPTALIEQTGLLHPLPPFAAEVLRAGDAIGHHAVCRPVDGLGRQWNPYCGHWYFDVPPVERGGGIEAEFDQSAHVTHTLAPPITDLQGASGRAILSAIVQGQRDPEILADLAKGRLRAKREALIEGLRGNVTEHHRFMLKLHLGTVDGLERTVKEVDERIEQVLAPFRAVVPLLTTIPGVSDIVAQVKRVADMINEISAATAEQTTGIGQINDAVMQLDQVTQAPMDAPGEPDTSGPDTDCDCDCTHWLPRREMWTPDNATAWR